MHFLLSMFFKKYGPSTEEGDVILHLSFVSVPVLEFAVTGLKCQRACFFFDEERIMTGILVLLGNSQPHVRSLPSALFEFSLSFFKKCGMIP